MGGRNGRVVLCVGRGRPFAEPRRGGGSGGGVGDRGRGPRAPPGWGLPLRRRGAGRHGPRRRGLSCPRADGVALGCLTAEGDVDEALCAELMGRAGSMPVTFHRAFDHVREPLAALETLIRLGVRRVLSSGQAASAAEGRRAARGPRASGRGAHRGRRGRRGTGGERGRDPARDGRPGVALLRHGPGVRAGCATATRSRGWRLPGPVGHTTTGIPTSPRCGPLPRRWRKAEPAGGGAGDSGLEALRHEVRGHAPRELRARVLGVGRRLVDVDPFGEGLARVSRKA